MSEPIDVSGEPAGSVTRDGRFRLGLTGPDSHVLVREAGRGDLVIGPAGGDPKADLRVALDDLIHWPAFDPFATPAGSPWPRHLYYHGNDSGFLRWSERRPIEQFTWAPAFADTRRIDARAADIQTLQIRLDAVAGHLDITVPGGLRLGLLGDLSRIAVTGATPDMLSLHPALGRRASQAPYGLPDLGMLRSVTTLALYGEPLAQPISLQGIERFAGLERLSLWGGFSDWDALARLPHLKSLEIRFAPDLAGLPPLDTWPLLERFIGFNVDDDAGKRLKAQLKAREKVRAWADYTSVSKLRKPQWWQSEYGRPFSGWSGRMAKSANAAYDIALDALQGARDADAAQSAIQAFAGHFNGMKGIETAEREDIGEAVWQFSQLARLAELGVTEAQALRWFDAVRDY
ncbi:hypothetical protein ACOTD8_11510 [Achromobacter dolens]|uniref:hypothetical protein n=1 Tax=Achromobacter dolens TaxID=1287738 RepID=UPI003B9B0143